MSILCSIIRLIPYMMRLRLYAYAAAVAFALMWTALVVLKIAICEADTSWKSKPGAQCVLGPAVGGIELASESPARIGDVRGPDECSPLQPTSPRTSCSCCSRSGCSGASSSRRGAARS